MTHSLNRILNKKEQLGDRLAILAHHYQTDPVVEVADITGDSLELARHIEHLEAELIVFCGVYFMAESAAILRRPDQQIFTPEPEASCPMADMADPDDVRNVLQAIGSTRRVVPLTYVNSSAEVKAVVGEAGGSVCTSANASTMLRWAMDRGDAVLFLPDRHLGWNTADKLGLPESERLIIDPDTITPETAKNARLLLWPGHCPVHDVYDMGRVEQLRREYPGCRIAVHPESPASVVQAADADGSTSFLIRWCEEAPEGSTLIVGTEASLVNRLAKRYEGRKTILHLDMGWCEDMRKITPEKVADLLENIAQEPAEDVAEHVKFPARTALERMLQACS
ncbi:quinolinate synthetase [Paucidesulfovibrio gracilis DSM 16080]|uniref:Quinolinate synthase n=1 Tax=Paucidesulfovibrio gracilis DSM 16080 TaxID=1121449 RepID=A0A1T4WWC8_9BACT|nr:quinolinate synthase NadA [Paucidesulfovibrio gracilis]SKA80921.1 quinolinate synthetase [Paucidesulfovibrio gracilis DSM 16080]